MSLAAIIDQQWGQGLWKRAFLWGLLLGPLFFASYGFANWVASLREQVPAVVYDWERLIPFVPWTIVPYWSIDFFYALSLFVCTSKAELDTHVRRLLTAQIVAVACFILFPLRFTFVKPATDGVFGFLFDVLGGFDKPFNQAPSLHIALLAILWALYWRHLPRAGRVVLHGWALLVGVSVLTTWQHHFIDIPTGALLGFFCLWLWPDRGESPFAAFGWAADPRRLKLAGYYSVGAVLLAAGSWYGGWSLWLLWGTVALGLVALAYAALGAAAFQKHADGATSVAARAMLAPYHLGAWLNSRAWTFLRPAPSVVADGVAIGRAPSGSDIADGGFMGVVDLAVELPLRARSANWSAFGLLDLVPPDPATLRAAADAIEAMPKPLLVSCALGYSRSAAATATWLIRTGRARDVEDAVARIAAARPRIALDAAHRAAIAQAANAEGAPR